MLQDLENHIICGFSWPAEGAVSGLQLFKAWIIKRTPSLHLDCFLLWGSASCLAPIVETGSRVSGHFFMMPLPSLDAPTYVL